jgi:hypothetical protein
MGPLQWSVTLLLIAGVTLLAAHAGLTWFYVSAINRGLNVVTTNQAKPYGLCWAVKEQQVASNTEVGYERKSHQR